MKGSAACALIIFGACGKAASGSNDDNTGTDTGETGSDSDATTMSSTGDDSDDSDSDDGGPKFDIAPPGGLDMGGSEMPTCANIDEFGPTSVGCEFWSVDVPILSGTGGLGVAVGNPWDLDVVVTFEDKRGANDSLRELGQVMLGPRESQIVAINGPGGLLDGQDHVVIPGLNARAAFRVTSDTPITAMQINPNGGSSSFVPDASMLLPTNALEGSYFALGYESLGGTGGWAVVVATQDDTTITTTMGDAMMDAFDAQSYSTGDATGFFVGADKPVAVFSGTTCSNVPNGTSWCDHVEEQVIPTAAWGTRYVGARHPPRMPDMNPNPEEVYWRVIAAVDDTTITFTPPIPNVGDEIVLAKAGDWSEFHSPESFLAEAPMDRPFMLVQYMAGGTSVGTCTGPSDGTPVGDPNMLQMVPTEQWLTTLPFLTDTSYIRDYVVFTREAGTEVDLECLGIVPDDRFVPIMGTEYEVGFIDLDIDGMGGEGDCADGQQFVLADAPIGVSVGGIDCAASYAYPGGLSLDSLWVPPTEPPG